MERKLLAKTIPEKTIQEHTSDAIKHYDDLKKKLMGKLSEQEFEILRLAVLYHDLGKANEKFQNKLTRKIEKEAQVIDHLPGLEEIPHNYLSCAFVDIEKLEEKFNEDECFILCMAIYLHHVRRITEEKQIRDYINNGFDHYQPDFGAFVENIKNTPDTIFLDYIKVDHLEWYERNPALYKKYVMTKGLLNRIDYAASSSIPDIEEDSKDAEGLVISDRILKKFSALKDVQQFMLENKDNNLVVTAATGIGKTEAALLWINDSKGFYTLPLKFL